MEIKIKPYCASCGCGLPETIKHFIKFGNFCASCDLLAWHRSKLRDKIKRFEYQEQLGYEVREKVEQTKELLDRLIAKSRQYNDIELLRLFDDIARFNQSRPGEGVF